MVTYFGLDMEFRLCGCSIFGDLREFERNKDGIPLTV
jgi:hypothetical protein